MTNEWVTLQPFLGDGRRYVRLKEDNKRRDWMVGKLVLTAWADEQPPDKPYVWHKNGKIADDRLENLCWSKTKQYRLHKSHREELP